MNIEILDFVAIPAIVVICYLVAEVAKLFPWDYKYIPVICGVAGCLLGLAAMQIMPDYPANDYFTAAAIGIVSGLAATGANQITKIVSKK
jgi:hypothetical protein